MSRYRVVGLSDGYETPVGEYDDAVELASAMWELGLSRPEFDGIRVYESPEIKTPKVTDQEPAWYLVRRFGCSLEEAHKALEESHDSVIHAAVMLEGRCAK